jgi:hypothetical protein
MPSSHSKEMKERLRIALEEWKTLVLGKGLEPDLWDWCRDNFDRLGFSYTSAMFHTMKKAWNEYKRKVQVKFIEREQMIKRMGQIVKEVEGPNHICGTPDATCDIACMDRGKPEEPVKVESFTALSSIRRRRKVDDTPVAGDHPRRERLMRKYGKR